MSTGSNERILDGFSVRVEETDEIIQIEVRNLFSPTVMLLTHAEHHFINGREKISLEFRYEGPTDVKGPDFFKLQIKKKNLKAVDLEIKKQLHVNLPKEIWPVKKGKHDPYL